MNARPCCSPSRHPGQLQHEAAPAPATDTRVEHAFVHLPAGTFLMGTDSPEGFPADGEGPQRAVEVEAFAIAAVPVTNAQFNDFVRATRHVTQAEEAGSSFIFYLQGSQEVRAGARRYPQGLPWWIDVGGACWQRPHGPGSTIHDRMDHPVVHVSWHDAQAYCRWAGVSLPAEREWEYAARGGLQGKRYAWGDEMPTEPCCNIWRGEFPNRPEPGWLPGTMPVHSFAPNGYGLFQMAGNVWEWCDDWFQQGSGRRAMRGGSFLCHDSYCNRYRVAARSSNTPESCASNIGFRVVA